MLLAARAIAPDPIWGTQNTPKPPVSLAGNYLDGYRHPNQFPGSTHVYLLRNMNCECDHNYATKSVYNTVRE